MTKVYFVRHAQVVINHNIPPAAWQLSVEGVSAARQLARRESWNGVTCIYHSPENKAKATAEIIGSVAGIATAEINDLRELRIPPIASREEFYQRVKSYLEGGGNDPEFEDWDAASERIVNCINQILTSSDGTDVAVVSHGRILSVLFSHILGRRVTFDEWQSIGLPDLSVVDQGLWSVDSYITCKPDPRIGTGGDLFEQKHISKAA